MEKMRLDKYLANGGAGSRTDVKNAVRKGRVTVNGETVRQPDRKIVIPGDVVCLDQKPILYDTYEYYLLYKPAGCVSATRDTIHKTVLDYVPSGRRSELFPAGRLDKDTEGLLLITNDGELAHRLLSPAHHVDKTYYARIKGHVTEGDIVKFRVGMDIGEEKPTLPAKLTILSAGDISEIEVTIQEGKFHQVKRMFQAVGKEVLYLKRLSMGTLTLDPSMKPGDCRRLTEEELRNL